MEERRTFPGGRGRLPLQRRKRGSPGRLTANLLLLRPRPSAKPVTSSNKRRHAHSTTGRSRSKLQTSPPHYVHRSLHRPTHGPFSAYFRSSPPLSPLGHAHPTLLRAPVWTVCYCVEERSDTLDVKWKCLSHSTLRKSSSEKCGGGNP